MEVTTHVRSREGGIVGRVRERAELDGFLGALREGGCALVLVVGEAGVGKTRLVEDALAGGDFLALRGGASQEAPIPYGPIVAALRSYLRVVPDGLGDCGPLSRYLPLLLPELGPPPVGSDRATLSEALCCAFRTIAHRQPTVVFLDDLHWADHTTLELLPALAASLEQEPLLIVGAYRSDEIPRGHPLRRMRTDLRRAGRLREIPVEPLDAEQTSALAARILGRAPDPALGSMLYDRTQGVPFFIEELASALISGGRIKHGERGAELNSEEVVPLPETVRDAILLRTSGMSEAARAALEVAAVVGLRFDLEVVAELADTAEGVEDAIGLGFITELGQGLGGFRHALVREALYGEVGWARRRALHRRIAERLEADAAPAAAVAEHWIAARELRRTREALAAAAEASCAVHAYRDAARAARRALDIWPEGEDEAMRLDLVDRLGQCAELSGDLGEAARAWREVAEGRLAADDLVRAAESERRLAGVYELQGMWERAVASRQAAAGNFAASGLAGEAAAEWLAVAAHLHTGGSFAAALEFLSMAAQEADRSARRDLTARALGLMGATEAKLGRIEEGRRLVREGLALALEHSLTAPAAECYQRLASVLENAADYSGARDAYAAAIDFCQVRGLSGPAQVCLACLAYILRQTGDWGRGANLCRGVLDSADAPINARITAAGMLGWIHTSRGETRHARRLLVEAATGAKRLEMMSMEFESAWGLARLDELEGNHDSAAEHCRSLLERWQRSEDRHYAIPGLRWATTFFACRGSREETLACVQALAEIASATGNKEALAALTHALGEAALLEGDPQQAARHFGKAIELLGQLELPFERAQTQLRAGAAQAVVGDRRAAVERLSGAYQTARKLGARPLASAAARELAALGATVDQRHGGQAVERLAHDRLSQRELEVLGFIVVGRTNRDIARELFLSLRTVDMHVRNILAKLDCRSRTEAVRKAGELGLID